MKRKVATIIFITLVVFISIFVASKISDKQDSIENNTNTVEQEVINNISTKEIPSESTEINENNLEAEGFEEESTDFISGNTGEDSKFIVGAKQSVGIPVYYSQIDSRWKNHPYTITGNPSQTIGTSGCGPTSAAMVVSTIKGAILPPDMGDLYVKYGFRTTNNGTYFSAFKWTADYFGIEYSRASNLDSAINAVRNNNLVIVSCGKGLFTSNGHFIVIVGIDGDMLRIYDPYLYNGKFNTNSRSGKVTVQGTTVFCTISNFRNYANSTNYFCFKNTITTSNNTTNIITVKYVTAKSGLNVRTGPSKNYRVITTYGYNTAVSVYEESNGWSRIGTNAWVSSQYLSNIMNQSTTTNTQSSSFKRYDIKVTAKSGLNVRTGPSTNYKIVKTYTNGTIATIQEERNGWGRTPSGWIDLIYTTRNTTTTTSNKVTTTSKSNYKLGRYKVTAKSGLNVRTGPSTNYKVKKLYSKNTVFDTYEIKGDWTKTPSGWVNLKYTTLLYEY